MMLIASLALAFAGLPFVMLCTWFSLRYRTRRGYVPTAFFLVWASVILIEVLTVAVMFWLADLQRQDHTYGLIMLLLVISAAVSAFVLAVLFLSPRTRPKRPAD